MTQIVNIKSGAKYDVYCGRPGKGQDGYYGNPHIIGFCEICQREHNREDCINEFRKDFYNRIEKDIEFRYKIFSLRNKTLGCFCVPAACHVEVIKEFLDNLSLESVKCIIAGSRTINDYDVVKQAIYDSGFVIGEVVCGEATGPDSLGKKWAEENNIPVKSFPADWYNLEKQPCKIKIRKNGKKYNILAGFNRNLEMAEYAKPNGALICVHNNSNGSLNMIKLAKEKGLIIYEKVVNG